MLEYTHPLLGVFGHHIEYKHSGTMAYTCFPCALPRRKLDILLLSLALDIHEP